MTRLALEEGKVLFGKAAREGIVAVEPVSSRTMRLFVRQERRLTTRDEAFEPFILLEDCKSRKWLLLLISLNPAIQAGQQAKDHAEENGCSKKFSFEVNNQFSSSIQRCSARQIGLAKKGVRNPLIRLFTA